jgi:hypothetical protein
MADVGVRGNGHFGYLELNSTAYFKVVEGCIASQPNGLGDYQ